MSLYLNKNGETYTEDELIGYAEEEGLSLDEYMETKTFTMVEEDSSDDDSSESNDDESGDDALSYFEKLANE